MDSPAYEHSQYVSPLVLVVPVSAPLISLLVSGDRSTEVMLIVGLSALLGLAALLVVGRLRILLDQQQLVWGFGWLPRPRWRLPLDEIASVELSRSRWCEGWGINRTRDGMLYNARGFDAVRIVRRDGRVIRLGTDEPARLRDFIQARLPRH